MKVKSGSSGYYLAEGDVVRIGRCKFRVKDLNSSCSGLDSFSLCNMISQSEEDSEENLEACKSFKLPCRICLSEVYEPDNPLISPCKCGGTMKFIHLKCLQQCLMSKLTTKSSETVLSFSWKKLGCDLCKKTYPYKLILPGKTIELLEIPKPPGQYIILEVLCKDQTSLKGLHIIHLSNKTSIKIGRAQDCDLRIADISVSRNHAKLCFHGGKFTIEDTGSKFGTLIQIKRPIILEPEKKITVQSGRSLITYSVKKPWSIFPACFQSPSTGNMSIKGVPILPFNTGIPLSIDDPYKLLSYSGLPVSQKVCQNEQRNILNDHNQLGANSSFELGEQDSIEDAEEVEIASDLKESTYEETDRNQGIINQD